MENPINQIRDDLVEQDGLMLQNALWQGTCTVPATVPAYSRSRALMCRDVSYFLFFCVRARE